MPKKDFYQISLKLILKNDKGEALILKGHPSGGFADFYDLPGGRIDDNEFETSFTDILKREVAEELGSIEISVDEHPVALGRHFLPADRNEDRVDLKILYIFFEGELLGGELKVSDEHAGSEWITLETCEPSKLFISGILDGIQAYLHSSDRRII